MKKEDCNNDFGFMVDTIEGTDIVVNCVVDEYLKYNSLYTIYSDYTYSRSNKSLYELPFLYATLIHFFEIDKNIEIEARRTNGS